MRLVHSCHGDAFVRRRARSRRRAAGRQRRRDVSPLSGRRHHRPGALDSRAEEARRSLRRQRAVLPGHDLERLDRRHAVREPVQGDAHAEKRRRGVSARQDDLQRGIHQQRGARLQGQHLVLLDQPGHVRRPHHRHAELQPRLGPDIPRHQGERPDHQRPDVPPAGGSSRLWREPQPDPEPQSRRHAELSVLHRPGLSRQPVPADPLRRSEQSRRLLARHRRSIPTRAPWMPRRCR